MVVEWTELLYRQVMLCRAIGSTNATVEFLLALSPRHTIFSGDLLSIYVPVNNVVLLTR